ncbi:MAG: hypothetical protein JWO71_4394 [Candidatus Acidoferrum typicum]|nr:hypothetical protein [Candidatus Acidoferrum typicum]
MKVADPKTTAARAFVRSLNILLKFARLYGFDHVRTVERFDSAWGELRSAIPDTTNAGLLLAATGSQLLLDGVPLEGAPAEKQFAELLSAAGVGSVQFFPSIAYEELDRFVRAFPTGKSKPAELALQLKEALAGVRGIRINEICFVATDSRMKDAGIAAQLAAVTLGSDSDQFNSWMNDPQKLLEMIAAAQGSKGADAPGSAIGSTGGPANGGASGAAEKGSALAGNGHTSNGSSAQTDVSAAPGPGGNSLDPTEAEMYRILTALTSFGQVGASGVAGAGVPGNPAVPEELAQLPVRSQDILKQALAELAAKAPSHKPDQSVLIQLAEHLAIRFALERFERGEVKVNAVRQMLDRMNQEIDSLRKILGAHEDKMSDAGLLTESHREILDRQFWAAVPESGKRAVLLSQEAWCIPPKNVQSYVNDLVKKGDIGEAVSILQNYAACTESEDSEARRKSATGISQLAELYARTDPNLLGEAMRHLGLRLSVEQDAELQALVSAAFVRLSQQAATNRCFPAMEQALGLVAGVESQRPGIAQSLRGKMGIEERIPEFVEEALRARQTSAGLTNVLRLLPQSTMEQLASRFNRCSLREDAEHIANLASDLGEESLQYLRSVVRGGPVPEAAEMVGLLSKLDPQAVEVFLPGRIKNFPRISQDRVVRQLSASGAPGRCRILLNLLDHVDPLVMPLVIDEIGIAADREALGRLTNIIDGDVPAGAGPFLRVRAAEAMGRIHAPESITALKRIVESKKVFGWAHPQELRIAALQSLEKLDPSWAREFLPKSGLTKADLTLAPLEMAVNCKFVRQRRHTRVRLQKPLVAYSVNLSQNCRMDIRTASLAGGVAVIDRHLPPGTPVQLKMNIGLRNLQATALLRDYRGQGMSFEIVDMNLEERGKLRRLLADNLSSGSVVEETTKPIVASEVAAR